MQGPKSNFHNQIRKILIAMGAKTGEIELKLVLRHCNNNF